MCFKCFKLKKPSAKSGIPQGKSLCLNRERPTFATCFQLLQIQSTSIKSVKTFPSFKGKSTENLWPISTTRRLRKRQNRSSTALWRSEEHTSELQSRENLVCR